MLRLSRLGLFALAPFLLIAAASAAEGAGWFVLPNSPQQPFRHQDIAAAGPTRCWIVSGRTGAVSKTTDGGASWQQIAALPGFLRSVGFADSLHGWIGCLTPDSLVYQTTNGGTTWALVNNIPVPRPLGICGLSVVNASVVYGCGRYSGPAHVIKTTDGGATWTSIDMSAYASTLVDCYFVSVDSGLVVGGIGTFPDSIRAVVLATTDGGASWEARFTGDALEEWCWKISFPTRAVGYVSLERGVAPVAFLKTTDGGATWARKSFLGGFPYVEQGIGFATEQVGWIGGDANNVYGTTDGGETWQMETWGTNVNRFRFVTDSFGFAVGQRVYRFDVNNPTFVAAGPRGDSPLDEHGGPTGSPIPHLFWNAPNPFHAATDIAFALEEPGLVTLAVYDLIGRRVATLVEAPLAAGPHRAQWNGEDESGRAVASGVYVCRLAIGGHHEARQMRLLR